MGYASFFWGPMFRVVYCLLFPARGVEEPTFFYCWRNRRTHLLASSISHVFKDAVPVCQRWRVIIFSMVVLTPVSLFMVWTHNCLFEVPMLPYWREESAGPDSHVCSTLELSVRSGKLEECFSCCTGGLLNWSFNKDLFWTLFPLCFACVQVQEKTETYHPYLNENLVQSS